MSNIFLCLFEVTNDNSIENKLISNFPFYNHNINCKPIHSRTFIKHSWILLERPLQHARSKMFPSKWGLILAFSNHHITLIKVQ